jgi:hypothetical protein
MLGTSALHLPQIRAALMKHRASINAMALQNTGQFPQLTTKMTPKKSGSKKGGTKRGC